MYVHTRGGERVASNQHKMVINDAHLLTLLLIWAPSCSLTRDRSTFITFYQAIDTYVSNTQRGKLPEEHACVAYKLRLKAAGQPGYS